MVAVWLAPIYIMAERRGGEVSTAFHFSPPSRLGRFMDLKHARGFDFIYFITHSLVYCAREQPSCRSATITRGAHTPLVLDYAYCRNPICFLEWEKRFICRCGPLEVTRVHKTQTHMSGEPRVRGHLYITPATCNASVRCIFKWDAARWENDCHRQEQDFSHYAFPISFAVPGLDISPRVYCTCTDSVTFCSASASSVFYSCFIHSQKKKFGLKRQGKRQQCF